MFPLFGRCPPESGQPPEALEMLSRVGNAFFAPKKRFPGLGTHFLCQKNGFPHWECIFYAQEGSPESGADLRNVFFALFWLSDGCCALFPFQSVAADVNAQHDEKQDGEAPQRGAAVAEEGQGNADYRSESQDHAHIDEDVEQEDTHHAIAIHTAEDIGLPLGQMDEAQNEAQKQCQDNCAANEALFLAHGAEDEVGVLLGHIFQFGLRAV